MHMHMSTCACACACACSEYSKCYSVPRCRAHLLTTYSLTHSLTYLPRRGPLGLTGALAAWATFTSVHLARLLTFTLRLQRTAAPHERDD